MKLFDRDWVVSQKNRPDMTHEERVRYVSYLAMWSNREPTLEDIARAALCLPDSTLVADALAAAEEVSRVPFQPSYMGMAITVEQTTQYTLGDLSRSNTIN